MIRPGKIMSFIFPSPEKAGKLWPMFDKAAQAELRQAMNGAF